MDAKHIVVVGAGPGGLTAAMILAHRGFKVSVYEANERVGGRNASLSFDGYTFDVGPTFLMLRSVMDEVFVEAGTSSSAMMDIKRLEPMYRLQFKDKHLEPTGDPEQMKREIARAFPGKEDRYDGFFEREKARFTHLFPCLQKSYHRPSTMLHRDIIKALPHMALGKTLYSVMHDRFGDEELALSFTFQSKYLGMSPWQCPGLFSMIAYIEHAYGIYHVQGGLSRISDAMADVVRSNGGEVHCNTPVKRIIVENGVAKGVELESGDRIEADDVVINADFAHAATTLFEPGVLKKWTPATLEKKKFSCSTFMLYLGVDKLYDMPHHTIFFADDYRRNVEQIFNGDRLTDDLSFYVRNSSVTDPTVAPEGCSAVYVLVPVPNQRGEMDWATEGEAFRETVLTTLEKRTPMRDIREHIATERVIGPTQWESDYKVYAGATFNLAHNIGQMLYFRPRNKFEEVGNCYLAGGGTHPGSGLPTIYESGRIAANLLSREHGVPFVSNNLQV